MKLAVFEQEEFFEAHEFSCELMLALSGVQPLTTRELTELVGEPSPDAEVGYTPSAGYHDLREAIAALHPPARAENVMVTVGAIEAWLLLSNILLGPGDELLCLWPAYQPLHELARGAGAEVRFVTLREERGFAIDLDEIEAAIGPRTRVVMLNVPHNPTGQTVSPEALRAFAARVRDRAVTVVVDEVFREMRREHPPSAWDGQPNLVTMGSMSKSYGLPGLRIGWLLATPELAVTARRYRKYTSLNPGSQDQLLALAALRNRTRLLERSHRLTEEGARLATRWLAEHEDTFRVVPPAAGGLFFPRLVRDEPTLDFCNRLVRDTKVLLAPGSACYGTEGFLRLGAATPHLEEGLARIDAWLRGR